jgi:predicted 3-demethylubiquinone-9 3-methyltransferase (glyoxalase superfamily)
VTLNPRIYPHLWYDREAREAAEFYCTVFPNSRIVRTFSINNTPSGEVEIVDFELAGHPFQAISAGPLFKFNEAISLVVACETQEEIDHYWEMLSAVPEAEQCGWLKDRFGVSWQVAPSALGELLAGGNPEQKARVTEAFLQMKKFDLAALQRAYDGAEAPVGGKR